MPLFSFAFMVLLELQVNYYPLIVDELNKTDFLAVFIIVLIANSRLMALTMFLARL